jgi:RHS repeat-associated protein
MGSSSGNLSKQSAFAVTNFTYDPLDRPLTRTYPADSTLNVSLTWDQTTGHGSGVGHLTSVTDQAGSLSLSWEQRGLLTSNARTIGGTLYTTGYTFESAGRMSSTTYPVSGWKVSLVRDSAGQVTSITDKPPSSAAVNLATSITHMPFGPVASFTFGNGITDTRTYDLDYRMTEVKDVATGSILDLTNAYDADNNVHTITDAVTPANNQTLTWDAIDRLKTATGIYGTISSVNFDSNSNRLAYGATSYTVPSTSNKMSAAGGSAVGYSSTGNIASIGTLATMTWNKANQLATNVVSSVTSSYVYDAFWQRLKVTVGAGTPSITAYDQANNILFETNSGTETDYAWLDGFPIAAIQPAAATVSAIHTDHLGTPQKATNASKTVVWTCNYDPNGKCTPTATITMNLRLPGQYADATGFNHNGFRDYNPTSTTGAPRYLQVDPIGLAGGMNPYVYAGNNPYKNIDPWGLDDVLGEFFQALLPVTTAPFSVSPIGGSPQSQITYGNQVNAFRSFEANMVSAATAFGAPVGGIEGRITSGAVCTVSASPEARIIAEAGSILSDPAFSALRAGYEAGRPLSVRIGGRVIQYEPDLPGSGLSLFGENGFLLGPEAFASESETQKTVLHELYRLNFSQSANGVSGELAAQETMDAAAFAAHNAGQLQ